MAYTDDIDIIYNDDGTKSFLQVDRSILTVDEAKVSNLDEVHDMEIIGNTVYFCGEMNGSPGVGWFDIGNLFSMGGGVEADELYLVPDHNHTGSLDFLYTSDYGSWTGILHPKQIDILHSLDRRTNGMGMIVSGEMASGYLGVWEAQYITTSCANTTSLTLDGTVHDVYDWEMEVKTDLSKGLPDYYPATLNNYPLTKICDD